MRLNPHRDRVYSAGVASRASPTGLVHMFSNDRETSRTMFFWPLAMCLAIKNSQTCITLHCHHRESNPGALFWDTWSATALFLSLLTIIETAMCIATKQSNEQQLHHWRCIVTISEGTRGGSDDVELNSQLPIDDLYREHVLGTWPFNIKFTRLVKSQ